jgi:hypothetical protein
VKINFTLSGLLEQPNQAQERRLSRAIGSNDGQDFAALDSQRGNFKSDGIAITDENFFQR